MTSSGKRPLPPFRLAQRKSRKTNKVNLHASQNDENNVVGFNALAGGLKELQVVAAGVRGYLVNDQVDQILNGIERVLQDEIYVSEKAR